MRKQIVSYDDLTTHDLQRLFDRALTYKRSGQRAGWPPTLRGKIMASLFFEPSTRTRFSFEFAMTHLDGKVVGSENAGVFSSTAKNESLEDTIRVVSDYHPSVILLRHPKDGAAERAAQMTKLPFINGGDGKNEHPTQAFLDFFTIWEAVRAKRFVKHELTIVFLGDNTHSRVVHSDVALLATKGKEFDISVKNVRFIGVPGQGEPRPATVELLRAAKISWSEKIVECVDDDIAPYLDDADIVYVTRSQHERHEGIVTKNETLVFDPSLLGVLSPYSIVMHPLPRDEEDSEMPKAVDADPRAWYFKQSQNGLFIRMALLEMLLLD